ncbi:MAG: LamG domain-containing protein [Bacteroidales bacterium]|nr:LamG domain-containing protein [Bacteroidales bacterium]
MAGGSQPAKIGERWYTTSKPYSLYKGFDSYNEYNLCADRDNALKAARFDNSNSYDHVTYTPNSTVSVWFKFGAQDFGPIVSFYPYTSFEESTPDYVLWSDQSGKVYFNMNHSDYQRYHLSSTNSYNDNTWHNATIAIGDVFVKLYIDGQLIAQTNYSNATMNQNGWIYYGGGRTAGLPNELSKLNINGSLDDFLLYQTMLTNDEIKAIGSRPVVGLNVDKTIICENSGTVQVKVINPEPGVTYTVIDNATDLQIGNPFKH